MKMLHIMKCTDSIALLFLTLILDFPDIFAFSLIDKKQNRGENHWKILVEYIIALYQN